MANLILQKLVPLITSFVLVINSIGGLFGNSAVIPYNPERTDVVVSGTVITDKAEVLEYYNAAVKKTGFVLGTTGLEIIGTPTVKADGYEDTAISMDAYWQAMESTSTAVFKVPGEGNLTVSDIKSAKMSVNDGKRSIIINVKDYKHGLTDENTSNPMINAFGFSTDSKGILESMNMNFNKYECTYTDCEISCVIDDNGKIIYGDWDHTGEVKAYDITVSFMDFEYKIDEMSYKMKTVTDI